MNNNYIPLCIPEMSGKEKTLVGECFDTNWVSYAGSYVERFEQEVAAASGAKYSVATTSGTAALHLALVLAGVTTGDEVIMPGISFVAPANAVRYLGAWPCFLDIEPNDWQISAQRIRHFLESCHRDSSGKLRNPETNRIVSCVLPVHLLGGLADSRAIGKVCTEFDLPMVEDVAECLGSKFHDREMAAPIDTIHESKRYLATSFNGNKIITTGGGGAVITNDGNAAKAIKHLSTTAKSDDVNFFHDRLGYNYRLTNTAAAMGVAQIETLSDRVMKKRKVADFYNENLKKSINMQLHPEPENCHSSFWLYTVNIGIDSAPVIRHLEKKNIQTRPVWHPLSDLPYMKSKVWSDGLLFGRELVNQAISLPCSSSITINEQERVMKEFLEFIQ